MIRIHHMLYIAARDHVFAINLSTSADEITPQYKLTWKTKPQDMEKCALRGKNNDECYNYIKVLVSRNDQTLFACGTNAFNPTCRNYKMETLEQDGEELLGQARCPFESKQSNVALFADGNLYSATMADFLASDAVIYRSLGERSPVLRTVKYDSKWLREPHFHHAIEYGRYVYFFFSEIAVEYTTLGKYRSTCGPLSSGCLPPSPTGHLDITQSKKMDFGVSSLCCHTLYWFLRGFSSHVITGSGVCAFYMDDIEKVFSGKFKEQKTTESIWSPVPDERVPKPRPGSCAGEESAASYKSSNTFPDETLSFIKSYPLMDDAVPSVSEKPWFTKTTSRYKLNQIAVDTEAGPDKNYTVVFLGSEDGKILKVLASTAENSTRGSLLLEEVDVYNPSKCNKHLEDRRILGLELDKEHHALFAAFSSCVIRVPLSRCQNYGRCKKTCLRSQDPYCIWLKSGTCANLPPGFKKEASERSQVAEGCLVVWPTPGRSGCGHAPRSLLQGGSDREGAGLSAVGSGSRDLGRSVPNVRALAIMGFPSRFTCAITSVTENAAIKVNCNQTNILATPRNQNPLGDPSYGKTTPTSSSAINQGYPKVPGRAEPDNGQDSLSPFAVVQKLLLSNRGTGQIKRSPVCLGFQKEIEKGEKGKNSQSTNVTTPLISQTHAVLHHGITVKQRKLKLHVICKMQNTWVRRQPEADKSSQSVHFTLLIACVVVAFALGAFLSGLLVSCYCSHVSHKTKKLNKEPEATIPHALSLRSLAKLNGLLDGPGRDEKMEVSSPKLYHTLISNVKEQQVNGNTRASSGNGKGDSHHVPELSGLPTPESTPELPVKSMKAFRNQWEKNQNCNNAKDVRNPIMTGSRPNSGVPVQVFQFPNSLALSSSGQVLGGSSHLHLEDRKIPNVERIKTQAYSCYPQKMPPPQSTLERSSRHPSQRHSMCSAPKMINGCIVSRQHSFNHRSGQPPPPLLARMNSTGSTSDSHRPFHPNGYLSRQHSYNEQEAVPRGGIVRRTCSLKPDVPPKPMFIPATSPVNSSNQFNY
ncbi:SEM6D protein, partial [Polypterus senegalus]|nr:SEM6D protein [Polypterus senegalus]